MVDIRGIAPAYMGNMTLHGMPDPSAKNSLAIEESKAGSGLSGGTLSGQSRSGQAPGFYDRIGSTNETSTPESSKADKLSDKRDEKTNAGPPPSFQISILELERDLSSQLARMNAEQSLTRDVQAVSPTASGSASDRMGSDGMSDADLRPTIEAPVSDPMAEPFFGTPKSDRSDSAARTENEQALAPQPPATEKKVAESPVVQSTFVQNFALQGPAQPALAEGV